MHLDEASAAVERSLRSILGDGAALRVPFAGGLLCTWYSSSPALLAEAVDLVGLQPDGEHPAVHVAVGEPGDGVDGFRRSHHEAMMARRAAMAAGPDGSRSVRYRDITVAAMVSGNLDRVRDFVRRELGLLLAGDDEGARLRETLSAFLAASGSHLRASEILGVHRNTVVYRLRRCEELLGGTLTERRLQVELALHLVESLGLEPVKPARTRASGGF